MTIASKHFDPYLGIDIHTYVFPPIPVPIPLPTPHIGMVLDPFDYIPVIGATVHVHGIKRGTAGTGGLCIHIPLGMWVPPFRLPAGPQWMDDEVFMGSKTVLADGDPFSRMAEPVLDCNVLGMIPPIRLKPKKKFPLSMVLPTALNLSLPSNVLVGGPSTVNWMALAFRGAFAGLGALRKTDFYKAKMEAFANWRRRVFKSLPSPASAKTRSAVSSPVAATCCNRRCGPASASPSHRSSSATTRDGSRRWGNPPAPAAAAVRRSGCSGSSHSRFRA
jgi:hypothetical protein